MTSWAAAHPETWSAVLAAAMVCGGVLGVAALIVLAWRRQRGLVTALTLLLVGGLMAWAAWYERGNVERWQACRQRVLDMGNAVQTFEETARSVPPTLDALVPLYLNAIPTCPAVGSVTYAYLTNPSQAEFTVMCRGHNHRLGLGTVGDRPAFSASEGILP